MGKSAVEQKNKKVYFSDEESGEDNQVVSDQTEESSSDEDEESSKKRSHSSDDDSEVDQEEEEQEEPVMKKARVEPSGDEDCTVWVGQLSFRATQDDIQAHFESCGAITEVRLRTDPATGNSRGFAYIDFADGAGKKAAMKLDGTEFMERFIKVDNANAPKPRNDFNKSDNASFGPKTDTVFVANLAHSLSEDDVRQAFAKFGNIVGEVRLPFNRDTGRPRGFGYIQFETEDEAEAAVKAMNGVSVDGRPVRTDFSTSNNSDRSGGFNKFGGRGGRGGNNRFDNRSGGGFRGGRGGSRGGFRGRGGPRY